MFMVRGGLNDNFTSFPAVWVSSNFSSDGESGKEDSTLFISFLPTLGTSDISREDVRSLF